MDVSEILGESYKDDMSKEELIEALGKITINDGSAEIEKLKAAISKSNSEAADYKRQLKDKLSAEENAARENQEKWDELQSKYETLLREKTIDGYTVKFCGIGCDEKTAGIAATAYADGNHDKVFDIIAKAQEAAIKKAIADYVNSTPAPKGGTGSTVMTKDKFLALAPNERLQFSIDHPEEYAALYKTE